MKTISIFYGRFVAVTRVSNGPITVYDVSESMALGMADAQILAGFSSVTSDHIRAGLAVATARERRLTSGATT